MIALVKRLNDFLGRELWLIDTSSLSRPKAFFIQLLRLVFASIRESSEREITLRAMSLVYTTLLSIVPLFALSFSVLKAFGVHNELEPLLNNFLAPLGPKGNEITQRIMEFVENMKVGVLGSLGLLMLIYTVISLIHKIEQSLNHIWKIEKTRSITRRFSDYISLVLVGPITIISLIGLTTSIMSNDMVQKLLSIRPIGIVLSFFAGKLIPYVIISAVFTSIYIVVPNTKVRFRSALLGGTIAGMMWQTTSWAFASFVVSSASYSAIYSGFATIILFMIWLYLNWLILLIGAEISFCHQNLKFLTLKKEAFKLSHRLREKLCFIVTYLISFNYYYGKKPWTFELLVEHLGLPEEPIRNIITQLENSGLVVETADNPPGYIPARDIETIKLRDILKSIRGENTEESLWIESRFLSIPQVDQVMRRIDEAIEKALGKESIKDLVLLSRNGKEEKETPLTIY
ncbi:MAG: hypothetical protein KatS3mg078_2226 [Deltaproteobacteria bacterium]|jgi:membrane protein|nr:MAG: hypothetical protein KatS3mg078_2226 [Deltaproteobacteria bacterium]